MARRSEGAAPVVGKSGSTRDAIKTVTTELLIRHGYHGTSFRNIAERLDTTTTNIHYHFGNKEKLVEEVLRDYVNATSLRHQQIWQVPDRDLRQKLRDIAEFNFTRYKAFNKDRKGSRPWSLIGRLRLDGEILSPEARECLASFTVRVHDSIRIAVRNAHRRGELREDAPLDDIAFLLVNIVNSSSVFTQDAGSFERLEQFFDTFSRVVLSAYAPSGISGGNTPSS
ncbi:TetR family transcriptional regulator [Aureimonas sp. Leaf454]|uniref:TetR/AcrR family transcriptional regulator n=1 Tax=Aureimonas sp. Leaf454 TaxID=1736381 RepID=UPI0006F6B6F5|nr:TetR/AcrR family transcriptional regulator [Aureimonas sp. Leaf454]KQT46179.1 TetR family transcriptional regulator [Aureimonas sp. Leaf454]